MAKHEIQPWTSVCRCGGTPEREVRFDECGEMAYHRYVCPRCGVKTGRHLTRWEAQAEWEEKHAAAGG